MGNDFDFNATSKSIEDFRAALQSLLFTNNLHIDFDYAFLDYPPEAADHFKSELHPEESRYCQALGKKRQTEFIISRYLARNLFKQFSLPHLPLLPLDSRMPNWPQGIIGSIAHSSEICMVAIAQKKDISSIGIDVETRKRLQPKLWTACFTDSEILFLSQKPSNEQSVWATLMFSAKESFFKYQYPLTHQWLGLKDAEIVEFPKSPHDTFIATHKAPIQYTHTPSSLTLKVLKDLPSPFTHGSLFKGFFACTETLIMTAFLTQ